MRLAEWHSLADADHARRDRGIRQEDQGRQQQSCAARWRRRHARRHARGRNLASRPRSEAKAVFGTTSKAHPGANYVMNKASRGTWADASNACNCLRTTTTEHCASLRRNCAPNLPAWAGVEPSLSKPATPCTAPTWNSRFRAAKEVEANLLIQPERRHDQARRRRLLHPRPLLPAVAVEVPARNREALAAATRDANGRTARSHLARAHPQEPWLHPLHRRPRPRRPRQGPRRRNRSTAPTMPRKLFKKHEKEIGMKMVDFQQMVYLEDEDKLCPRQRSQTGRQSPEHLRHRAARPLERGRDNPALVHLSRSGEGTPPQLSATRQTRRDDLLHRPFRLGQVHHRQRSADEVARSRRTPGHASSTATWCAKTFRRNSASRKNTATSTSAASATSRRKSPRTAASHLRPHRAVRRHPQTRARR